MKLQLKDITRPGKQNMCTINTLSQVINIIVYDPFCLSPTCVWQNVLFEQWLFISRHWVKVHHKVKLCSWRPGQSYTYKVTWQPYEMDERQCENLWLALCPVIVLHWCVPCHHSRLGQPSLRANPGKDIRAVTRAWIYGCCAFGDQGFCPVLRGRRNTSGQN